MSTTPQHIGRYEVQTAIGQGGMAAVYLAYDPRFRRQVAIKLLPEHYLSHPVLQTRFEREAQTIARIEHPAIVPVYDFGKQDEQPYLVMRYMAGGSLYDRLRQGPLSLTETTRILNRLAPALDVVHTQGIVHRDLKPGNILFDAYDNAYLSDFGIAHVSDATQTLTGEALIGTPAYMSPEQVRGQEDLDARSDIYSLGVIVFEMLGGRQPYQATTPMALAMRHITDPIPHLSPLRPELPASLDSTLARALAKDREARFATAGALAADLNKIAASAPTQAPAAAAQPTLVDQKPGAPSHRAAPTAAPGRPRRWYWLAGGLAGFVLLLVGLVAAGALGTFMVSRLNAPGTSPAAGVPPAAATAEPGTGEAASPQPVDQITPRAALTATPPAPGSTPEPSPVVAASGEIFADNFNTPSEVWPVGDEGGGRYGFVDGRYEILVRSTDTLYWVTVSQVWEDAVIEVETSKIGGPDDNYFGVICRLVNNDNFYYLVISSDGYYTIGKLKDGRFVSLFDDGWRTSNAIRQGPATNLIRAECLGNRLRLIVNGNPLAEVADQDFTAGEIGLAAAALDIGGVDIRFDNFQARAP